MHRVTFRPGHQTADCVEGASVLEAAREAGIAFVAPCGGRGTCGRCKVRLLSAGHEPTAAERGFLDSAELARGVRLACELKVDRDLVIELPGASRAVFTEILSDGECVAFELAPPVEVRDVSLMPPELGDNAADLERLDRAVFGFSEAAPLEADLSAARELPSVLRASGFKARALLRGRRLLRVVSPGTPLRAWGVSFDIGTTTVAGSLVDLATGTALGVASRTNPQHVAGDDVVTRMDYAARGEKQLAELQRMIVGCMNDVIAELAGKAGGSPEDVHEVTLAGNTVMAHLALGLPPQAMATAPFAPVITSDIEVDASELGLRAAPRARVWVFPARSAYVGGDIVAGMLAVGFGGFKEHVLYIDIGTNGEVVAGSGARAFSAATAAGPAFEGAGISSGMRAVPGAIRRARFEGGALVLETVGGIEPVGVCGSGLIDLIAAMLAAGVIDGTGRIEPADGCPLAGRVREGAAGPEFVVSVSTAGEVVLTQRDVRELQLAKGAVAAGAAALVGELGLKPADLDRVLLAGAFGSTLDPASAVAIGLLPEGIEVGKVRPVGNTAAAGARAALASLSAREEARRLARWMGAVELSAHAEFQSLFADAMLFPS